MKKILSVILSAAMLLSVLSLFGITAFAVSYSNGDIIEFGSYPQALVTDNSLVALLNAQSGEWLSYNYFSGNGQLYNGAMKSSDYMRYKDVIYNGNKYRAVTFDSYRPSATGYSFDNGLTYQDDNGYTTSNVYWFKYEPLKWRILDKSTGLVMCDTIIDSQPYNNYILNADDEYYGNAEKTYKASDYANSSIRKWLNEDFCNVAFNSDEKSYIATTTLNNNGYYTLTGTTGYEALDSVSTNDKIFLLSYDEANNTSYFADNSSRRAKGSDYAKCQGLLSETKTELYYFGCSYWFLRSPGRSSTGACVVTQGGNPTYTSALTFTDYGIRPALNLNLPALIVKNAKINVRSDSVLKYSSIMVTATADSVPDGYYVALYDGTTQVKKGDSKSVSYDLGETTSSKTLTAKIVDGSNDVQKDSNGKDLTAEIKIEIKSGFFNNLIGFFKRLFGSNKVTINP